MTTPHRFAGIDLGAESGRVMLGTLGPGHIELEEVHRFVNEPVLPHATLVWDLLRLRREVLHGLGAAVHGAGGILTAVGVDSWGVDFGLLDRSGEALGNPVCYRDARTAGVMEAVATRLPRETIFAETGIQFLSLNTLYQLAAMAQRQPEVLGAADRLLLMADLIAYFLCGRAACERSLASTTQMWNPRRCTWSQPILDALGLRRELLPEVVPSGTALAELKPELARMAGARGAVPVVATAAHDTAAAVAAVPADGDGLWGYLSSGTWSLLGVELNQPVISPAVLARNFTNEAGVAGTTRFLRNINGLWLVQECRRAWARAGEDLDYAHLMALAAAARPDGAIIVPGRAEFFAPRDMPEAIRDFCRRSGQPVPATQGEVVRCALESLALAYREAAEDIRGLLGRGIDRLHVVGGGSRNALLNQLTADALNVPVLAGPVEATAMGNILVQAMAVGCVGSLSELRGIVARSSRLEEYRPRDPSRWDDRFAAYLEVARRAPDSLRSPPGR